MPFPCPADPSSSTPWPTCFPTVWRHRTWRLSKQFGEKVDVPKERQFLGFDAYRNAIDCLRPGDVALLTTYAGFRADAPGLRRREGRERLHGEAFRGRSGRRAADSPRRRGGRKEEPQNRRRADVPPLLRPPGHDPENPRRRDGADPLIRTYRMDSGHRHGPLGPQGSELLWQIRRPDQVFWYASGVFVDWTIHLIDECCWIKDAWPVRRTASAGGSPTAADCGQNLDSYSVEYTFADGTKAMADGPYIPNCFNDFATFVHGTKCAGQFSGNVHAPTVHICKDQRIAADNIAWKPEGEPLSPYHVEWKELSARSATIGRTTRPAACGADEPGRHHGPGGRPHRQRYHLGRDDGLEVPVLPERCRADRPEPRATQADKQGRYPVPLPGPVDGNLKLPLPPTPDP